MGVCCRVDVQGKRVSDSPSALTAQRTKINTHTHLFTHTPILYCEFLACFFVATGRRTSHKCTQTRPWPQKSASAMRVVA